MRMRLGIAALLLAVCSTAATSQVSTFTQDLVYTGIHVSGQISHSGVAAALYNNKLYVTYSDHSGSGRLWLTYRVDAYNYSQPIQVPGAVVNNNPAIGVYNGKLWLLWDDPNGLIEVASTTDLEHEHALLLRSKESLEKEQPLRELEMTPEEKKLIKGFMFLSQKPILYALNIGESGTLGEDLAGAVSRFKLNEVASRPNAGATAICGKVEAELSEMDEAEAAEFLASYGLEESGLERLIRKSYELLGLISFFTAGEDECRAWTVPLGSRAPEAAGAIHSDLQHHFIRAETIRWDALLEAGSEANARSRGTLRLEGKEYVVHDGDVMHIRHSG